MLLRKDSFTPVHITQCGGAGGWGVAGGLWSLPSSSRSGSGRVTRLCSLRPPGRPALHAPAEMGSPTLSRRTPAVRDLSDPQTRSSPLTAFGPESHPETALATRAWPCRCGPRSPSPSTGSPLQGPPPDAIRQQPPAPPPPLPATAGLHVRLSSRVLARSRPQAAVLRPRSRPASARSPERPLPRPGQCDATGGRHTPSRAPRLRVFRETRPTGGGSPRATRTPRAAEARTEAGDPRPRRPDAPDAAPAPLPSAPSPLRRRAPRPGRVSGPGGDPEAARGGREGPALRRRGRTAQLLPGRWRGRRSRG